MIVEIAAFAVPAVGAVIGWRISGRDGSRHDRCLRNIARLEAELGIGDTAVDPLLADYTRLM